MVSIYVEMVMIVCILYMYNTPKNWCKYIMEAWISMGVGQKNPRVALKYEKESFVARGRHV